MGKGRLTDHCPRNHHAHDGNDADKGRFPDSGKASAGHFHRGMRSIYTDASAGMGTGAFLSSSERNRGRTPARGNVPGRSIQQYHELSGERGCRVQRRHDDGKYSAGSSHDAPADVLAGRRNNSCQCMGNVPEHSDRDPDSGCGGSIPESILRCKESLSRGDADHAGGQRDRARLHRRRHHELPRRQVLYIRVDDFSGDCPA